MLLDHDVHLFDKSFMVVMQPGVKRSGMFCVVEARGRKGEERVGKKRNGEKEEGVKELMEGGKEERGRGVEGSEKAGGRIK